MSAVQAEPIIHIKQSNTETLQVHSKAKWHDIELQQFKMTGKHILSLSFNADCTYQNLRTEALAQEAELYMHW